LSSFVNYAFILMPAVWLGTNKLHITIYGKGEGEPTHHATVPTNYYRSQGVDEDNNLSAPLIDPDDPEPYHEGEYVATSDAVELH